MRVSAAQLFGGHWLIVLDDVGRLRKETLHHAPQTCTSNACAAVLAKPRHQWRLWVPARRRDRKFSLDKMLLSHLFEQYKRDDNQKAIEALKKISPVAWQHIHFLGHYAFRNENRIDLAAMRAGRDIV